MSVLIAILGFGLLVFVHELGHYCFARLTGMKVDVFSIGFGPTLYHFERGETVYQLALLPFGGYVKIRGLSPEPEPDPSEEGAVTRGARTLSDVEREWGLEGPFEATDELKAKLGRRAGLEGEQGDAEPEEGSFQSKSLLARFMVVAGGPLFNILFTIFAFWLLLASSSALSVLKTRSPSLTIREVSGVAQEAGLQVGDVLLSVNGVALQSFEELKRYTRSSKGEPLRVVVARPPTGAQLSYQQSAFQEDCLNATHGAEVNPEVICARFEGVTRLTLSPGERWERVTYSLTPKEVAEGVFMIGVTPELDRFGVDSPWRALSLASVESIELMRVMYEKLIGAARGREQVEVASVVKITAISADTVKMGSEWFINFLAFLSLNLALLNLLPLPALDGGRLIFLGIEAVSRRPVPPRIEMFVHAFGVIFLIALTLWVTAKDVLSLM